MRRLPSLAAIEAFVHVARLGSIKAAAEALALSSPALTRRIQALERFVGKPLFERRHQAVVLNGDGERLLHEVGPLVDSFADAMERAGGNRQTMRLRLAVPSLFASQRLMPCLPVLRARYPDLHIDIDTGANRLARLNDGLDAAIAITGEVDPKLYARRIDRNHIVVIGSREMQQGPGAIVEPAQLASATVFLHRDMPETFSHWAAAIGMPDLEPAAIDHFDSGQLILDAAAQGLGVAFMLDSHLSSSGDERLVQLFEEKIESPYNYWFACRPSSLSQRPVRIFHDWLFETFK
ncbi:LysR substrate-binding domain-containing protein [Allosphingosinicella sp.]|jgi:LysR family glycine cleavage system transcriptional activator|uniref:LysR substrate-binding domain-containing protein n=1 Tax=Allosphingosinicella sp. TaxID=2823234 RepID=UPI002F053F17